MLARNTFKIIALIWLATPAFAKHKEIPRFHMVAEGLYRGGQPSSQGFELLRDRGIKTVINLRMEDDESAVVQSLGMNCVHIPVEDTEASTQIPEAAIAKYFEVVNNPANYPIFFHCHHGVDRTGTMAALYRMAIQGWSAEQAYTEALTIGMRPQYAGLKAQIYDFVYERLSWRTSGSRSSS
jgi:tyrosine-protein phosphatase SIW14